MKFINYLESISGVSVYPMTSLMIFFIFFILVGIKVWMMDKNSLTEIMNLPLNDGDQLPGKN
jgi:cytochrome c oxidase cbb3-type subunit 3